ncbi:HAD hydrolase, family IIB [Pseudoramibacter alactolyticus ATCC 23263]|uniref:HAD hydrolase, family IIB n=1 Tax=Pseudoramibacter alactolyticus ATCC 23263 TaxID=887929 RepID=E6MFN5_9FIRM|nr:HAD-IIB family hydrolase [Pseudoramibacter alactolyticus]EFV02030.1 HAD hydrolase, family IIB [Pseudoramibacter alactolyticus ATCC 23263]
MKFQKKIRLMALDLDDTLLTTDKRFTERTREVLRECMNRDIRVVTASGRFLESQLIFVKNLNLGMEHSPQIGDGGGTIFTEEKLLWRLGKMTKAQVKAVLAQIHRYRLKAYIADGLNVYYERQYPEMKHLYAAQTTVRRRYVYPVDDLSEIENPLRFIFYCENEMEMTKVRQIHVLGLSVYHGGRTIMEIASNEMNKFQALNFLCRHYGLSMDEVAAVGDSENDLSMIRGVGLGMAVGNAASILKSEADVVGSWSNDEDGAAKLIEKYVL